MGAGRKTQTFTVSEKAQQQFTVNCSATARNLRKSDLAGVIFGCKHNTYGECLSKKLFGLPSAHYSYVKNIEPGLPLFLFNYSNRKLHGIFEAASSGKLAISSSAWTTDGSANTPYAAQVKIQIRMLCQPLLEDQFQPIIADNYYERRHFWFELDQAQTSKLISVFSSSPVITSTFLSKKTQNMGAQLKALRAPNAKQECDSGERSTLKLGFSNKNPTSRGCSTLDPNVGGSFSSVMRDMNISVAQKPHSNVGWFTWKEPGSREERQQFTASINNELTSNHQQGAVHQKNCDTSYSSVVRCPKKKWSALFKEETRSDATKEVEEFNLPSSKVNLVHLDLQDCLDESSEASKAPSNLEDFREYGKVASLKPNCEAFCSSLVTEPSTSCLRSCSYETLPIDGAREERKYFHLAALKVNLPISDKFHKEWNSSGMSFGMEEEKCHLEVPGEENPSELPGEDTLFKLDRECSLFPLVPREIVPKQNLLEDTEVESTNLSFPELALAYEMNSSSIHSTVAKLLFEVGELRLSQFKQAQKVNSLEQKLFESRLEIQQLKDQCRTLETGFVPRCVEADDLEKFQLVDDRLCPPGDASIYMVGGFDGCSWLSALDIYSSSQDLMRTWTSMSFLRTHASVSKFSDELYILGGLDGNLWCDTVESYNPLTNQWTIHPALNQKKASFSVLALEDSMFVFGCGNGVECFSEVERFDPNIGRWFPIQSLLNKRFAPATAEVHGILYASGGYDGKDYLKYAIGGFDGSRMVSTVEVFDPRGGTWMMEESMKNSRGYFGSVVMGDEIHVIGGYRVIRKFWTRWSRARMVKGGK